MGTMSNIDDVLMSGKTNIQPATPEHIDEIVEEVIDDTSDIEVTSVNEDVHYDEPEVLTESNDNVDDYGNPKPEAKTYSEEEVNERIQKAVRERLERFQRNNPEAQEVYQESNTQGAEEWEQQLEAVIEQKLSKIEQNKIARQQQQIEQQAHAEFQDKFTTGMNKFPDFVEVVSQQPISDAMTYALRGVSNPAAFIYAASKRNPQELQRISSIKDPYAQMVEMGKLEERMRKNKTSTTSPKPVSRTKSDSTVQFKKEESKELTGDDLIRMADQKKLALINSRRR